MMYIRNVGKFVMVMAGLIALATSSVQGGDVRVRGYYRSNGSWVTPHYRSSADGNFYNNWSTLGNYNPYTGQSGSLVTEPLPALGSSFGRMRTMPFYGSSYVPCEPLVGYGHGYRSSLGGSTLGGLGDLDYGW